MKNNVKHLEYNITLINEDVIQRYKTLKEHWDQFNRKPQTDDEIMDIILSFYENNDD